jgi:hypothetical protein
MYKWKGGRSRSEGWRPRERISGPCPWPCGAIRIADLYGRRGVRCRKETHAERAGKLISCLRNTFHNFRLLPGAGGQPAGLAKMRRRFLRGPSRYLPYGEDGSHFSMYLQVLAQRARVPLRRQRDGCVALHFPPILAAPTVLPPPGSTLNFSMLFLKHDTKKNRTEVIARFREGTTLQRLNRKKDIFLKTGREDRHENHRCAGASLV